MDFLDRLREKTSGIHKEIEHRSLFSKIVTQEITAAEYKNLLKMLYSFVSLHENCIQKIDASLLMSRNKSALLQADLMELGCTIKENSTIQNESIIHDREHALGYLYVIEGSTLGGQVLTRYLKDNKQLPTNIPTHYLNPYGELTRAKWMEFLNLLLDNASTASQKNKIIESAYQTFEELLNLAKY